MFGDSQALAKTRLLLLASLAMLVGCRSAQKSSVADALDPRQLEKMVEPSNFRNWSPELARVPTATLDGPYLKIQNIRHCKYINEDEFIVHWFDTTFNLNEAKSVDFIVVPFKNSPSLAHTMLSFGFEDDDYLAVSVEVRSEAGEAYSPIKGSLRQYEIVYVAADERDVIPLRTKHRDVDVYVYRTRATPQQTRDFLLDVATRMNKLAVQPEFYDSLTNNCTTNIVNHINRINPGRIPMDIGVLLPGYSDRLAYTLGLLDTDVSFDETKRRARVTDVANLNLDAPDFSRRIRMR